MPGRPSYEELEARIQELEAELRVNQWSGELFSRSMLESLPFDFWVQDLEGRLMLQSSLSKRIWGDLSQSGGASASPCMTGLNLLKKHRNRILAGQTVAGELEIELPDGAKGVFYSILSPVNLQDEMVGILGINFDVTHQRQAQEALSDSRHRLRVLLEQMPGAMLWTTDTDLRNTLSLGSALEAIGLEATQTPGMSLQEFFGTQDPEFPPVRAHTLALEGAPSTYEIMWADRTFQAHTEPLRRRDSLIAGVISVAIDVTERKAIENALRESEQMARALLNASDDLVVLLDDRGAVLALNETCAKALACSLEKAVGACLWDSGSPNLPSLDQDKIRLVIARGKPLRFSEEKMGRFYDVLIYPLPDSEGQVTRVAAFARDVTAQKNAEQEKTKLESQLQQAQKAEAIGTLAGGIAHDFNNILSAIMGYTEMCTMEIPQGTLAHKNLLQVLRASHRAKDLVGQILTFSRQKSQEQSPVQLGTVVKEALRLLRASLPSTITFRRYIKKDLGKVMADPTSIHQVLMNLCTNAAHAMRENGGVLDVRMEREVFEPGGSLPHPEMEPGAYLRLTVSDTGHGMDVQTMARIFDPYFTTKEMGEGTGLGLAVVLGIVRSHGGSIMVESQVGQGTTFVIYLPEIECADEDASPEETLAPGGREHVLLVDDEPALLDLGRQMMEHLGYQVTTFTNPLDALAYFSREPEFVDCIVTDQTMPHMTGGILAREVLRIRPDIPVVLCTGYSELISEEKAQAMGIRGYMMKPLELFRLSTTLRAVLDLEDS